MTGVFLGHSVYKAGQSLFNKDISLGNEIGVATWLGTSAFFAGGAWQPAVNLLHDTMVSPRPPPTYAHTRMHCRAMSPLCTTTTTPPRHVRSTARAAAT